MICMDLRNSKHLFSRLFRGVRTNVQNYVRSYTQGKPPRTNLRKHMTYSFFLFIYFFILFPSPRGIISYSFVFGGGKRRFVITSATIIFPLYRQGGRREVSFVTTTIYSFTPKPCFSYMSSSLL